MPVLSPVAIRLRDDCVASIDVLITKGKAKDLKSAAYVIYNRCRQRHTQTGFKMDSFLCFYESVRKWYRKCSHLPASSHEPTS